MARPVRSSGSPLWAPKPRSFAIVAGGPWPPPTRPGGPRGGPDPPPHPGGEGGDFLCGQEPPAGSGAGGGGGATCGVTPPFEAASVSRIDLNGRHGKVRAGGARIFYVLGGQGTFEVEGASLDVED